MQKPASIYFFDRHVSPTREDVLQAEIEILSYLIYQYDQFIISPIAHEFTPTLFPSPAAKAIYDAVMVLASRSHAQLNIVAIQNELATLRSDDPKLYQGCLQLLQKVDHLPNNYALVDQLEILNINKKTKQMEQFFAEVQKTSLTLGNYQDYFDQWKQRIIDLFTYESKQGFVTASQLVTEYQDLVHKAQSDAGYSERFLKTGYKLLDLKIKGLIGGQLIVVAARPGVGKTTFALNILAKNLANINLSPNQNIKSPAIGMFSLEVTKESLLEKLIAIYSGLEIRQVQRLLEGYSVDGRIHQQIDQTLTRIQSCNILFCDRPNITLGQIANMIRNWHAEHDLKLVILDYLQLVNTDGIGNKNTPQHIKIAEISKTLKHLTLELKIPIIALAQLNRKLEERKQGQREPLLSDLKESGAIEQDADIVLMLYDNEVVTNNDGDEPAVVDHQGAFPINLKIGKNRHGETGLLKFKFIKNTGHFDANDTY